MTSASPSSPVPVVCARCAHPFTLTPHAHARCLADSWLHTWQGAAVGNALLREGEPATP